jgi:hypothetical protein
MLGFLAAAGASISAPSSGPPPTSTPTAGTAPASFVQEVFTPANASTVVGQTVTFAAEIQTNRQFTAASPLRLQVWLPGADGFRAPSPAFDLVSLSTTSGSCQDFECDVIVTPPGKPQVTVVLLAKQPGTFALTLGAITQTPPQITVAPAADLGVAFATGALRLKAGVTGKTKLILTNGGPSAASAMVTFSARSDVVIAAGASGAVCTAAVPVRCAFASLPPNSQARIALRLRLKRSAGRGLLARVTSATAVDSNLANNHAMLKLVPRR